MWIFGYGSLMVDGWEKNYDCSRRVIAELHGYRRSFSKASVVNWGAHDSPCPTLHLVSDTDGLCEGVAFEFPDAQGDNVRAYLGDREGKGFIFSSVEAITKEVGRVEALVPLYIGKNVLPPSTGQALVKSIQQARGTSGTCTSYVIKIYEQLAELGINDPAVTKIREQLRAAGIAG